MATTPGTSRSRFPGFDITDQAGAWDPVTTPVVLGRITPAPPVFFTAEEVETVHALVDRLLAQDQEPRIPVVELIDDRLDRGAGDGYRYEDMPEDPEAWRASITGLEKDAHTRHGQRFADLERGQQLGLLDDIRTAEELWHGLPAKRVFSLWMRYACTAFYSHPWAWNEIGFGGPAYPRGYKNLGLGRREPWEVADSDAADPVPWASRAEAARRRHTDALAPGEAP